MGFLDKMKGMVAGGDVTPLPGAAAPGSEGEGEDFLEVSFSDPGPSAVTCPIRFDRPVSPGGTSLFETPQEAEAWPAVYALLGIQGVHSVIGKGDVLVVARREDTTWSELLPQVQPALMAAFEGVAAPRATAVPATPAPPTASGPAATPRADATDEEKALRDRVQEVIEREINPAVADHGGYITLLDVQGTRVFIHMGGGCQGCAMSTATLKHGVETSLRSQVPEVTEILDTTDHAAGENPYFQA